MIAIVEDQIPEATELVDLYTSVGWARYVERPEMLVRAVGGSAYVVVARQGDQLVGLARCVSDEVSIAYVQDILVRPDYQRQGIGRRLSSPDSIRFATSVCSPMTNRANMTSMQQWASETSTRSMKYGSKRS